jgi:hypothetical protein
MLAAFALALLSSVSFSFLPQVNPISQRSQALAVHLFCFPRGMVVLVMG